MNGDGLFIEQAEYIEPNDFVEWSSDHPNEEVILKKLTQSGAKLLTGPRGCGKTTLMLKAYNQLVSSKNKNALPIYVNFKSSLKIEPIYRQKANGGFWFSQWMYLKIYQGLYSVFSDMGIPASGFRVCKEEVDNSIGYLELGEVGRVDEIMQDINVYDLEADIEYAAELANKKRCVLLLDDAAHAFSHEQQRDFFEFFRKIKSRSISPKAAVYPGVTNFAPTFNVGHDAEEINAWVDPEDEEYFSFMASMLSRRLPEQVYGKIKSEDELLKVMCYAAFGIPRTLLNMVRNIYSEEEVDHGIEYKASFTKKNILAQVKLSNKSSIDIYLSLQQKIPTYKNYIEAGSSVFSKILDLIKIYNKEKGVERKSVTIAIKRNLSSDLKKVLGFFQYAGLVSYKGQVSRGEKGVFDLYLINYSSLIENNAVLASKSSKIEDLALSLEIRNAHEFTRTTSETLLPYKDGEIKLSLPPCQKCGAERTSDEARFCFNCGEPLKAASIYEILVSEDIDVLPLTEKRISAIKGGSNIKKVKDILHDIGHVELRSVPQVGQYWASKIYYLAEEYIS